MIDDCMKFKLNFEDEQRKQSRPRCILLDREIIQSMNDIETISIYVYSLMCPENFTLTKQVILSNFPDLDEQRYQKSMDYLVDKGLLQIVQ